MRELPIVCTLDDVSAVAERVEEWRLTASSALDTVAIPEGTRLRFDRGVDLAELNRLIDAELSCCSFLTFGLKVEHETVTLDVTGPPEATGIIDALIGPT